MRIMIELPDELLIRAQRHSTLTGTSLQELVIRAIEEKLTPTKTKVRRSPPVIGSTDGPRIGILTAEQLDEIIFG